MRTLKMLYLSLAAMLLGLLWPASANAILLKQSTAYTRMVLIVQSADHVTGLTGAAPTVTLSKAGGAFGALGGTVTEVSSGWYKIAFNTTDTGTLGDLAIHVTATSGDPVDALDTVIAVDLADSVRAGLTSLPNAAAGANTGLPVVGTQVPNATAGASGGLPTLDSQLRVATPTTVRGPQTATAGAAGSITLDASASATDDLYKDDLVYVAAGTGAGQTRRISGYTGSTKVGLVTPNWSTTPDNTSVFYIIGQGYSDVGAWLGTAVTAGTAGVPDVNAARLGGTTQTARDVGANVDVAVSSRAPNTLTTAAIAAAILSSPANLLFTDTSGNIRVGAYATGQDPGTLVWGKVIDGKTAQQILKICELPLGGAFGPPVRNTTNKTLTVTYYGHDGTTVMATFVTTYADTNLSIPTGKTVTYTNLP